MNGEDSFKIRKLPQSNFLRQFLSDSFMQRQKTQLQNGGLCAASTSSRGTAVVQRHNTVCNAGIITVLITSLTARSIAVIIAVSIAGISRTAGTGRGIAAAGIGSIGIVTAVCTASAASSLTSTVTISSKTTHINISLINYYL